MMLIWDRARSDNLKEQKIYIFADNCLGNQRKSYSSKRFFLDAQRRFRLALRFFRFAQPRIKTRRLTKQRDVYLHKLLLSCFQKKQKAQEVLDTFLCLYAFSYIFLLYSFTGLNLHLQSSFYSLKSYPCCKNLPIPSVRSHWSCL